MLQKTKASNIKSTFTFLKNHPIDSLQWAFSTTSRDLNR